jgi:nitrite reductase/ring-hydroxylating ferredoxin subunit
MGVTVFALGLVHGGLAIFQYHALGNTNPFVSVIAGVPWSFGVSGTPFQPFGLLALVILFLMAATSHDFWLANLTAPVWKALHMSVYVAWAAIMVHVVLGVVQDERGWGLPLLLIAGGLLVTGLHGRAALAEHKRDKRGGEADDDGWVPTVHVDEIKDGLGVTRTVGGERVAIFRWDGKIAALSNLCQHQNGPLGEGRVIDGCVTCPWHGYQYRPEDGASPPPFEEKVPTFRVRLRKGRVLVHKRPLPAGTRCDPVQIGRGDDDG